MTTTRENKATTSERPDGRRQLTTYLDPKILKALKIAAVEEDRKAYEVVEEAVADWLKARKNGRAK